MPKSVSAFNTTNFHFFTENFTEIFKTKKVLHTQCPRTVFRSKEQSSDERFFLVVVAGFEMNLFSFENVASIVTTVDLAGIVNNTHYNRII